MVGVLWLFGNTAVTLPVVGLYLSLRCRLYVLAALVTMAGAVFVPAMGMVLLADKFEGQGPVFWSLLVMVALPLAGTVLLWSWNRTKERRWMGEMLAGSLLLCVAGPFFISSVGAERGANQALAGAVFLVVTFQTSLAAWLGSRLSRDLQARNFVLPQ